MPVRLELLRHLCLELWGIRMACRLDLECGGICVWNF